MKQRLSECFDRGYLLLNVMAWLVVWLVVWPICCLLGLVLYRYAVPWLRRRGSLIRQWSSRLGKVPAIRGTSSRLLLRCHGRRLDQLGLRNLTFESSFFLDRTSAQRAAAVCRSWSHVPA